MVLPRSQGPSYSSHGASRRGPWEREYILWSYSWSLAPNIWCYTLVWSHFKIEGRKEESAFIFFSQNNLYFVCLKVCQLSFGSLKFWINMRRTWFRKWRKSLNVYSNHAELAVNKYTEQIDSTKRLCNCFPRFRFGCSKYDTFCTLFVNLLNDCQD